MKVVDLEKLWNFAVYNFFIWNRLGSQIINLCSVSYNMRGTKIHYRHMWARGAVIEEAMPKGAPWVRILAAAKCVIFTWKVSRLRSWQHFNLKSSCGSYRANRAINGRHILNDLGRRNYQNESCRYLKFMKLRCWWLFDLKSSCGPYRANRPIGRPLADSPKWPRMKKLPKWKL
jgi:hypothetical protein